eukprot:3143602-Pyramimonas_sp.AAC.1
MPRWGRLREASPRWSVGGGRASSRNNTYTVGVTDEPGEAQNFFWGTLQSRVAAIRRGTRARG